MSKFLLDTDILIWHLRGREYVTKMLKEIEQYGLPGCSALSVLEVQVGVKKGEEERTNQLLRSLTIFDVTGPIAERAAQLIREGRSRGFTIDLPDAVIAGTCIVKDLILVTCNKKHYPFDELKIQPFPSWSSH